VRAMENLNLTEKEDGYARAFGFTYLGTQGL
jgi:hypothetical protein